MNYEVYHGSPHRWIQGSPLDLKAGSLQRWQFSTNTHRFYCGLARPVPFLGSARLTKAHGPAPTALVWAIVRKTTLPLPLPSVSPPAKFLITLSPVAVALKIASLVKPSAIKWNSLAVKWNFALHAGTEMKQILEPKSKWKSSLSTCKRYQCIRDARYNWVPSVTRIPAIASSTHPTPLHITPPSHPFHPIPPHPNLCHESLTKETFFGRRVVCHHFFMSRHYSGCIHAPSLATLTLSLSSSCGPVVSCNTPIVIGSVENTYCVCLGKLRSKFGFWGI